MAIFGDIKKGEAELRRHLDMGPAEPLTRYVGCQYEVHQDRVIITQKQYVESLPAPPGKVPKQPLPANVLEEADLSDPLDRESATRYRSNLGALAFVANVTRPDLAYACTWLSKFNQEPTLRARRLLDGVLRYAKGTANTSIVLRRPGPHFRLVAHVDASFASATEIYPQSGFVVMTEGVPVMWKSCKQKRVCRSTLRAETAAMDMLVDVLGYYKPFFDLFWPHLQVEIATDTNDLVQLLKSLHPHPTEKQLVHKIKELQDRLTVVSLYALGDSLANGKYLVYHVPTNKNIADAMTKSMSVEAIYRLLNPKERLEVLA
jgi:hypothetical protein